MRFEVADTGIGIDQAKLPALFEPFSQADGSTAGRPGGTGLGLAISRQLVDMMGGRIGAHAELQRGSTFWFAVPFEPRPGPVRSSDTPPAPRELEGLRVLVVDDNATNRRVLTGHARAWNLDVDTAEHGPHALERMQSAAGDGRPYAIAILDMQMPGMDGIDLARTVAADPSYGSPAMIMLSSGGEQLSDLDGVLFASHVRKPVVRPSCARHWSPRPKGRGSAT